MRNSTFRVLICETPNNTIKLFVEESRNLPLSQRARILKRVGGAA